jgi:hypothetical protein
MLHTMVAEGDLAVEVTAMVAGMVAMTPALEIATMITHVVRSVGV